jgi:hypothetical protein
VVCCCVRSVLACVRGGDHGVLWEVANVSHLCESLLLVRFFSSTSSHVLVLVRWCWCVGELCWWLVYFLLSGCFAYEYRPRLLAVSPNSVTLPSSKWKPPSSPKLVGFIWFSCSWCVCSLPLACACVLFNVRLLCVCVCVCVCGLRSHLAYLIHAVGFAVHRLFVVCVSGLSL